MKKILFLMPHLENKGPVSQLFYLLKFLDREKYNPVIITLFPERENSLYQSFVELEIKIICLNLGKYSFLTGRKELRKVIELEQPKLIHSNSVITDILIGTIKTSIPYIFTLHNYVYEDLVPAYGPVLGNILAYLECKAINKSTVAITCSKTLKTKYEQKLNREFLAIQNGIDLNKWNTHFKSKDILRQELGLPKDAIIYLSTGLMIKRKHPELVLEAFQKLSSSKNIALVFLGDGDMVESCKKKAMSDQRIIFKGRVNNVKDYLYASDILVSAAESEGLPYAVLEAECTGIKLVLSDIPQHREVIVKPDEANFFKLFNSESLVSAVQAASTCVDRIEYSLDSFSAEYMSKRYQEVYKNTLEDR